MGKLWVPGCFLWEARRSDLPISMENSAKTVSQDVRLQEKFRNENQGENRPTSSHSWGVRVSYRILESAMRVRSKSNYYTHSPLGGKTEVFYLILFFLKVVCVYMNGKLYKSAQYVLTVRRTPV